MQRSILAHAGIFHWLEKRPWSCMRIIECRARVIVTPTKAKVLSIKLATQMGSLLQMSTNTKRLLTQYRTRTLRTHLFRNDCHLWKQELLTMRVHLKLPANFHQQFLKLTTRTASFRTSRYPHTLRNRFRTLMEASWTHLAGITILNLCRHTSNLQFNHQRVSILHQLLLVSRQQWKITFTSTAPQRISMRQ